MAPQSWHRLTNQPKKSYGDCYPPCSNFSCREIIKWKLAFNNQLRKTPFFFPNTLSKFRRKTLYSHTKFRPFSPRLSNSLPKSKQSVTIPEAADQTPNDIHKVSYFIDNICLTIFWNIGRDKAYHTSVTNTHLALLRCTCSSGIREPTQYSRFTPSSPALLLTGFRPNSILILLLNCVTKHDRSWCWSYANAKSRDAFLTASYENWRTNTEIIDSTDLYSIQHEWQIARKLSISFYEISRSTQT